MHEHPPVNSLRLQGYFLDVFAARFKLPTTAPDTVGQFTSWVFSPRSTFLKLGECRLGWRRLGTTHLGTLNSISTTESGLRAPGTNTCSNCPVRKVWCLKDVSHISASPSSLHLKTNVNQNKEWCYQSTCPLEQKADETLTSRIDSRKYLDGITQVARRRRRKTFSSHTRGEKKIL